MTQEVFIAAAWGAAIGFITGEIYAWMVLSYLSRKYPPR